MGFAAHHHPQKATPMARCTKPQKASFFQLQADQINLEVSNATSSLNATEKVSEWMDLPKKKSERLLQSQKQIWIKRQTFFLLFKYTAKQRLPMTTVWLAKQLTVVRSEQQDP